MISVKLPDGSTAQFPDGTPPDVMTKAIQAKFPPQAAQPAPQAAAPQQAPAGQPSLGGSMLATGNGLVDSIPVVGPLVTKGSDFLLSQTIGRLQGKDPGQYMADAETSRAATNSANPIANIGGELGGALGGYGALSATKLGADALGFTGKLLPRMAKSGASTLGMTAADNMARGEKPTDALQAAVAPGGIAFGLPLAGRALGLGAKAVGNAVGPTIRGALDHSSQAGKVLLGAAQRDVKSGQPIMNSLDEANAALNGQPVINADRFGSNVRTLARTAANTNPEAKAALENVTSDRFAQQGTRAVEFIKRITGGATNDLAYQQSIKDMARSVNKPAYDKAFSAPQAQAVWTPEIRELMQSDKFRAAIDAAESRGTDKAAVAGGRAVRNPFAFGADGGVTLKVNADGSRALPTLQFWDQVKRNLDSEIGKAQRAGDNAMMSDLTQMKAKLTGTLDQAVPDYAKARQGASSFFGAEDALDAGRQFASQPKSIPEATAAHAKFTPAEKQAFATGYASELIDRIKASRDRVNVINQVFGSQASREMASLALGPMKAKDLEAFVRVEGIMDALRGAVSGNSTTAQQLIAAGVIGGGIGGLSSGWDPRSIGSTAMLFTAGRAGLRAMGKSVDQKVMEKVAEMLASGDQKVVDHAIANAMLSPAHMQALEAYGRGLDILAKGSTMAMPAIAGGN